ncbi:hydrolase [Aliidongia dinghuensis]|uniref:Hydrolase n=1 Tax=Aliidongia dinghuensis TaxID=1867774 RepID=A0A8J3E1M1_9PROT|nr:haloacid dehalogenase type II [Aliidongia dinghuensis]GGF01044.1 hydrolase [Aliidongia dinghuensis]
MTENFGTKPEWLTFDCYGTLIQWDEGLIAAVERILAKQDATVDPKRFIEIFDRHEHALEHEKPHRSFRSVTAESLGRTMAELELRHEPGDAEILTSSISKMPPFPEVVAALGALKRMGFRLCIVSNTDDDIIAGNVAQLGGHIDWMITAEQAEAYKPSRAIFEHAYRELGVSKDGVVHICASPHLDHAAARDIGFRCLWIDRGTGRKPLADYTPDRTFATLTEVPAFFAEIGWG